MYERYLEFKHSLAKIFLDKLETLLKRLDRGLRIEMQLAQIGANYFL